MFLENLNLYVYFVQLFIYFLEHIDHSMKGLSPNFDSWVALVICFLCPFYSCVLS